MWRLILNKITPVFSLLFVVNYANAQFGWSWTELSPMPMAISNNAITTGNSDGEQYVYSFGGIDTSKIYSGITQSSFRYRISDDTWQEIAPLPTALPLIASAASTVKNRVYIIGGYNVSITGEEVSSNETIIYDPESNSYISGGAPIPIPIDDHVQCVWRDSLIYVITGWSNTGNVTNVQIYNPSLNEWLEGTPVPNHINYKVFGASGTIIGDTIYYYGGANQSSYFPASNKLRKGIIDPSDPTNITWQLLDNGPTKKYRSACIAYEDHLFWLGGSSMSYNYNGIAYDGSGGVEPLYQIMEYDATYNMWETGDDAPVGIMDLRGIARIASSLWIIAGGMRDDQEVSNKTFLISYDPVVTGLNENNALENQIYLYHRSLHVPAGFTNLQLFSFDGKLIWEYDGQLELPASFSGAAILKVEGLSEKPIYKKFIVY